MHNHYIDIYIYYIYIYTHTHIYTYKKVYMISNQQPDTNKFCHWWPGKRHHKCVFKIHHSFFPYFHHEVLSVPLDLFILNFCSSMCLRHYEILSPRILHCVTVATQQKDCNLLCWNMLSITWALQLQFSLFLSLMEVIKIRVLPICCCCSQVTGKIMYSYDLFTALLSSSIIAIRV